MKYRVLFCAEAKKQMLEFPHDVQRMIDASIHQLTTKPDSCGIKKLHEFDHHYFLRYGDVRILCEINQNHFIIRIISIDHRKNIY